MKTTELINLLASRKFTDVEVYNLLAADLFQAISVDDAATPPAQALIRFFNYQICAVLVPVIDRLREN